VHDQTYSDVFAKKVFERAIPYNPMEPQYRIKNEAGLVEDYGTINGSKPKSYYFRKDPAIQDNALKCRDIQGN